MMRPCVQCGATGNKEWNYSFDDATRIITATCKECGNKVRFNAKKRNPPKPKSERVRGEFETRNGKSYMKDIKGNFREICVVKNPFPWFMQVIFKDEFTLHQRNNSDIKIFLE